MPTKLESNDNYCLFIDTTNNYCYAALYRTDLLIAEIKIPVNKNVTDLIVDAINTLLITAKFKDSDLTHMCVNIGPGTFTGVKVGVVIAKAWKVVNPKLKIYTLNSLLLQCPQLPAVSVIDAKSNKLYVAAFDSFGRCISQPQCIDKKDLESFKSNYKDYQVYLDRIDDMYDNYRKYIGCMELVKDIDSFNPLYLKDAVEKK